MTRRDERRPTRSDFEKKFRAHRKSLLVVTDLCSSAFESRVIINLWQPNIYVVHVHTDKTCFFFVFFSISRSNLFYKQEMGRAILIVLLNNFHYNFWKFVELFSLENVYLQIDIITMGKKYLFTTILSPNNLVRVLALG